MKTKFFLLLFTLLIIPFSASAISIPNFTVGATAGSINTGNGYFDNEDFQFGYTGERNIYVLTELREVNILEPIAYSSGTGGAVKILNSTNADIRDSVVHNGFLYFVEGTTLYKKKTRANTGFCETSDTGVNGCISTITAGVGGTLRVFNNVLYYTSGVGTLKHLDSNDNPVTDFVISTQPNAEAQHTGWTITSNNSAIQWVGIGAPSGTTVGISRCQSTGCASMYSAAITSVSYGSFYSTTTKVYSLVYAVTGSITNESLILTSNSTFSPINYAVTDTIAHGNRVYVGSKSTIGMIVATSSTYETFNSDEVGTGASVPGASDGSGTVTYTNKDIDVPNPTYYNDSVIPINIALRFIISDANKTNYTDSIFWHVKINDPLGIQVFDLNLPGIACTQQTPWWDILGIFTNSDWACDGSGSIEYTRTPGQFWTNGSYTAYLTEQLPGQTFILDSDTWNIVNQTSNNPGTVIQPPSCPTCGISGTGTITVNTAISILSVLGFVAFWGFVLWLGIIGLTIRQMTLGGGSVNGIALIAVAWLSAVFIALVGLFDPFKIYIIILSTIIAAILFRIGSNATTGDDN